MQPKEKNMRRRRFLAPLLGLLAAASIAPTHAQSIVPDLEQEIRQRAAQIESKLIAWRRDIHEHPELGEQETRTANLVAEHLKKLGLEVKTGVANTGVVGLLKGGKPGPVVALRADMDALPVKEPAGLPFASKAKGKYLGREVDVMHACGHDAHTAILMATAEVLTAMRERLPGSVKFIFQPAEEGPSLYAAFTGKIWGAKAMVKEGVLQNPRPDAVFGLHVSSGLPSGRLGYRAGAAMASADELRIKVIGRQGHGGYPCRTVDPVTTAAQIVLGLQTIVSRRTDLMKSPTVVSVTTINGGSRFNIVPEVVEMGGTIRTYAAGGGGALNERSGASEDVSFFLNEVPGLYFNLGIVPRDQDLAKAAPNHSPNFFLDERALVVGVRALAMVTVNYLAGAKTD